MTGIARCRCVYAGIGVDASASARAEQAERERPDRGACLVARILEVEPVRRYDLVVARAAGMDLAPDRPEQPLDRAVHVLVARFEIGRVDVGEPRQHVCELVVVEQPCRVQALGVQARPLDVVEEQLGVLRLDELPHLGRERGLADPSGPERHRTTPSSASSRRASVMSLILTASWPMRSAAVNAVALRSMLSRSASYVSELPCVSRIV